jgi:hypothetical protein
LPKCDSLFRGNTLTYDGDSTGTTVQPRSFTYDGENRPVSVSVGGAAPTTWDYGDSAFIYLPI